MRNSDSHLIVLDTLADAVAYRDSESWRARVSQLESRWFAPLVRSLRENHVSRLTIVVPGEHACCRFDATRADLLKLWRRPKPLWTYA